MGGALRKELSGRCNQLLFGRCPFKFGGYFLVQVSCIHMESSNLIMSLNVIMVLMIQDYMHGSMQVI